MAGGESEVESATNGGRFGAIWLKFVDLAKMTEENRGSGFARFWIAKAGRFGWRWGHRRG